MQDMRVDCDLLRLGVSAASSKPGTWCHRPSAQKVFSGWAGLAEGVDTWSLQAPHLGSPFTFQ